MYFSEIDKKEMRNDAFSEKRKKDFRKLKDFKSPDIKQLCELYDFMRNIIGKNERKIIKTDKNIL